MDRGQMARKKVIEGGSDDDRRNPPPPAGPVGEFNPDDDKFDDELRPQKLSDVVGQKKWSIV